MLQNINSYGLSHLCAFSILEPAEAVGPINADSTFEYPFLDIYFKYNRIQTNTDGWIRIETSLEEVKFYSRGNKYYKTSFNNLFEYLIFNEQSGYKH